MLNVLKRWLGAAPTPIPDAMYAEALARVRLADALDAEDRAKLRAKATRFLSERAIVGADGFEVSDAMRATVAILASLPLVHLPFEWLGTWHEVVLYAGEFRVRRSHHDSDTEVVTEWDDELAGEAWEQGPIVLSWADIERDLDAPFAGFNVVIHEIAHKLDMADGASDGTPPLATRAAVARWTRVMQAGFDGLNAELDAKGETALDPYAAEAPDEFFATLSEYFFSAPEVLKGEMPEVYAEFEAFYRPGLMSQINA